MTIQDMYDMLGQAHTLNLISAEQFNSLVAGIEHEGWRDVVEFALLELGKHVQSAQIAAMVATPPRKSHHSSDPRVVEPVEQTGDSGVFRCRVCRTERTVVQTLIGNWPRGTWQCQNKCKLPTTAQTGIDSGTNIPEAPTSSGIETMDPQ